MKLVAFSDLHTFPHRFGATVDVHGRHSRLGHCLDVLEQTYAHATTHDIRLRVFAGDLFHKRGELKPSYLNPVLAHFRSIHEPDAPQNIVDILIPGNHDEETRADGEHALDALKGLPGVYVLDGHGYDVLQYRDPVDGHPVRLGVGWVSHVPDVAELKKRIAGVAASARLSNAVWKICLIHHGVDGVMPGIPDMGFAASHLPTAEFDAVLCGDYHNHKPLAPNAWMIGAPLQHNFGDAGQTRGWMEIDLATKSGVLIENTAAPKFVTVDIEAAKTTIVDVKAGVGNFVRVRCDDEAILDAQAGAFEAAGALAVQKELVRDFAQIVRSDVKLDMSTAEMFRTWLDAKGITGDQADVLTALNKRALAEAGIA